ncbi:MAG TPA: hypothetical protein VHE55_03415 [Fimbriimonadaceae bacterium]|nr:hypothetical protein [Fimbriimonadaceae bacterium]
MSHALTYEQLLATARSLNGRILQTVTGKEFQVGVYLDCPFFIPLSTGQGRSDGRLAAERFVGRYNEIGSVRPADYQDLTRNASYFVVLAEIASREREG